MRMLRTAYRAIGFGMFRLNKKCHGQATNCHVAGRQEITGLAGDTFSRCDVGSHHDVADRGDRQYTVRTGATWGGVSISLEKNRDAQANDDERSNPDAIDNIFKHG